MTEEVLMTYYWSNSKKGFFTKEIHGDDRPADCVELTHAEWQDYLEKQTQGFEIAPSQGQGKPILVDRRPSPTDVEAEKVRAKRSGLLYNYVDSVNQVRWNLLTADQQDYLTQYRQDLLDVPQQPGFPFDVIWPTEPDFKV